MQRLSTEPRWMTSDTEMSVVQAAQNLDGTVPAAPTGRTDLVDLHETIAKLLADQGNWELAYTHINAALRLARQHDCAEAVIPEQYQREVAELRKAHAEALDASLRDALTATYNRRYLDKQLDSLLASESAASVAVAIVDLDHFKEVNDAHGHLVGDRVLQQVVALLQVDLPSEAFCARYGGEEFVLVLPHVSTREAVTTLERARARVAAHNWARLAPDLRVTISVGLVHNVASECPFRVQQPRQARTNAEWHLRRADDLLYSAKRAGRNTVAYRLGGAIRLAGLDDDCR